MNAERGIERMIVFFYIVEDGNILKRDKHQVKYLRLTNQVPFAGRVSLEELSAYTSCVDIEINSMENCGLDYYHSLPNRIFGSLQQEILTLTYDSPEIGKIIYQ